MSDQNLNPGDIFSALWPAWLVPDPDTSACCDDDDTDYWAAE